MSDRFRMTVRPLPDELWAKYHNVYAWQIVIEFPIPLRVSDYEWYWQTVAQLYQRMSLRRLERPERFLEHMEINVPRPLGDRTK